MKPLSAALVGIVLLTSAASAAAEESSRLLLGGELGRAMRYTIETRETFTTTQEGSPSLVRGAEHIVRVVVKPVELSEKGGAAEVALEGYSFAIINPAGLRHGFDSAKPNEQALTADLFEDYQLVANRPVTVRFDASGHIFEIEGLEEIPPTRLSPRLQTELFSLEAMNRKIQPILGAGKKPPQAKPGDRWTMTDELPLAPRYPLKLTTSATLVEIRDGVAIIREVSHLDIPPVDPDERIIPVLDSGTSTGTLRWNFAKGELQSYEGTHVAVAAVTVDGEQRLIESRVAETIRPTQ